MQNGNIAYYKNTGTVSSGVLVPSFSLVTNTLGNVDTKADPLVYGYEGDAAPYFFQENGSIKLLVGGITGAIAYYSVPANILSPYNLITAQANGYNEGGQSTLCYEDINGDGLRDLFIGNSGGGLKFYSSKSKYVGLDELNLENIHELVSVFPNPTAQEMNVRIDRIEFINANLVLKNLMGQELLTNTLTTNSVMLDLSKLKAGVYFLQLNMLVKGRSVSVTKKIVKSN